MSPMAKKEYLAKMRPRYRAACDRVSKTAMVDEICATTGWHRKHVLRALSMKVKRKRPLVRRCGRPIVYRWPTLKRAVEVIWLAANMPCSKRLVAMLPLWLTGYELEYGTLDVDVRVLLLKASPSTLDRMLKKTRAKHTLHGRATTKPGTMLRHSIPVATNQWTEARPGYIEADTVSHCGETTAGQYASTLVCVDLATGWIEQRAVWAKADKDVVAQVKDIERALPFELRGFDSDNGSEFMNHLLFTHLIDRPKEKVVAFTRSRPYQKNDNAHVEQKNWTHVRQWIGYDRLDNPAVIASMNNLYVNEWRLFHNFYLPSVKLVSKRRIGSKTVKAYDKPRTPLERVLVSDEVSEYKKEGLRRIAAQTNPFALQRAIKKKIALIFRVQNIQPAETAG